MVMKRAEIEKGGDCRMKALDSIWFNNRRGTFGIVLGEDETTGERTLYAGVVNGGDEKADEIEILSWGNKVNIERLGKILAQVQESAGTIMVKLTEQDSAIMLISLELREMNFPPHSLSDRKRLPEMKKELQKKHNEVFDHTPSPRKK